MSNEESKIVFYGDWNSPEEERLQNAWFNAIALDHKLPDYIRYLDGMSGKKYRYLINNLIESTPDARYLEIGSWAGSTACSAMWGNDVKVTCIDNWSEFGGPKDYFMHNVKFCTDNHSGIDFNFIEQDFKNVDYTTIGKHNIYLFDGPHMTEDQYAGIALAQSALDDIYTLIVDDYNAPNIREGTEAALAAVGNNIIAKIEIFSSLDGSHPVICKEKSDWHNGYLIAIVSKT
jgi:hypothetical protein